MEKIKIGIANNHGLLVKGLIMLIEKDARFDVVLTACDGQDLINKLNEENRIFPHIILMNLNMPVMDGFTATSEVKRMYPVIKIVAFTLIDHKQIMQRFKDITGDGYLLLDCMPDELYYALEQVYQGILYFPELDT